MKARFILAVVPLILSACSVPNQNANFAVTHIEPVNERGTIAISVLATVNKLTTYRNTRSTYYVKSAEYNDGKLASKAWDEVKYGTVVNFLARNSKSNALVVSLEIEHSCRPDEGKVRSVIDIPSQTTFSSRQILRIKRGENLRISGKDFDTGCAFPTIIFHPTE